MASACYQNQLTLCNLLFAVVDQNWAGPTFLSFICRTSKNEKHFGWRETTYVNKHGTGCTMQKDGNSFHTLSITTAGNLSVVEMRYGKLKVNFNHCFKHNICQNQFYKFIYFLFLGRFIAQLYCTICLFFFSELFAI